LDLHALIIENVINIISYKLQKYPLRPAMNKYLLKNIGNIVGDVSEKLIASFEKLNIE
jgi:hypothetical protein